MRYSNKSPKNMNLLRGTIYSLKRMTTPVFKMRTFIQCV